MDVCVVGAAAVWDYLLSVEALPDKGGHAKVTDGCPEAFLGGCAPNIAVGLHRLGVNRVRLYYPVGGDAAYQGVPRRWENAGIDCSGVVVKQDAQSGKAWIFAQSDGCTMCFSHAGAADEIIPEEIGNLAQWVVIAPVLNQFTRPFLEEAIQQSRRVIMTGICSEEILLYLNGLLALIVNQHEAEVLCGSIGAGSIEEMAGFLSPTVLYVTNGKLGSTVYHQGRVCEIPVIPAEAAVDVTGAGDAFTAGVVYGLMNGYDPADAAYIGACCSSFVIEVKGAQTNLAPFSDIQKRLDRYAPDVMERINRNGG